MSPPTKSSALPGDLPSIRSALDRLQKLDAELRIALEDLEHESRRCNDAMERAGWRSGKAESRGALLTESRKAITLDLEKNQIHREQLTERLHLIQKGLKEAPARSLTDDH
jgi:chromosome segregation ATPase